MWNLVPVRLSTMLVLVQDMRTICSKHTIAQKSFWTHPMVRLGDEDQVEDCLGPFRDSVSLDTR
jgi:hypothetical protein